MTGECGKARSGITYHYYSCVNRKKHHICKKKPEKKLDAEAFVVERTMNYIITPANIARIAKAVVEEYDKEFAVSKEAEIERAINRIDHELNKLVDALIDAPKVAHKRIYEKMELLEAQKADLEQDLAKQKIAAGIRYTEQEVTAWIRQFAKGDITDPDFRKSIIDVFVNCVYFYDNRVVIFYNINGGKTESPLHTAVTNATSAQSDVSDLKAYVPLHRRNPNLIPVGNGFGFLYFIETENVS